MLEYKAIFKGDYEGNFPYIEGMNGLYVDEDDSDWYVTTSQVDCYPSEEKKG